MFMIDHTDDCGAITSLNFNQPSLNFGESSSYGVYSRILALKIIEFKPFSAPQHSLSAHKNFFMRSPERSGSHPDQ